MGQLFYKVAIFCLIMPVVALADDYDELREFKLVLWPQAYRTQDVDLLDELLHDSFEMLDASGNRSTKQEELDYVRDTPWRASNFEYQIERFEIYQGLFAVIDGQGATDTYTYRSSNYFIKEAGNWQAVSSHVSGYLPKDGDSQTSLHLPSAVAAYSDRNPTVSPDGTRIIFHSDRTGRRALYMQSVDGGPATLFLDSGDEPLYADWSPNGKQIVFAAEVNGEDDIFVIDVDGKNRRRLTAHPARDGHPRWSPDGARVFFNSERVASEPEAPQTGEDVVDIFSVRADGTNLRRHTWCRSECSYPSVSPDGTKLLYRRVFWTEGSDGKRLRNSDIVTANLDGSDEVNLTDHPAYDVYPIWSHDGQWVYFSSVRPAEKRRMHLWRVAAAGGSPELVTDGEWHHRQAVPDRQGNRIYMFSFQRLGEATVGYIGAVDAPQ